MVWGASGCGGELEGHVGRAAVDDAVDDLDVAAEVIGDGLLRETEGLR